MRSTRQLNSDHPIGTLLVGADDPRVRRAMHLLFEKQVLVDVVKDVSPLMTGGFIYRRRGLLAGLLTAEIAKAQSVSNPL